MKEEEATKRATPKNRRLLKQKKMLTLRPSY